MDFSKIIADKGKYHLPKYKNFFFQSTFCSDVMSDDGTTSVSADTDYCGYGTAEKYMEVCEDGDDYYILTSGVPDYFSGGTWCKF